MFDTFTGVDTYGSGALPKKNLIGVDSQVHSVVFIDRLNWVRVTSLDHHKKEIHVP